MRTDDRAGRGVRTLAISGVGAVIVTAAAVALSYTPLFAAGDIRVFGSSMPRTRVLTLAGVGPDTNVFHLDTAAAEAGLERDPRILEARITTTLPDGISIRIEPRSPVGIVGVPAMLVGADGVVIGPAGQGGRLPFLRSSTGDAATGDALAAAAAAAGALPDGLRADVEAIVVGPDATLDLILRAGFSAYLGQATELEAKAASLAALLEWAQGHGRRVRSADLAVPGSPTAELEDGSASVPVP
jgi:cell division septal protein FtsQ